MSDATKAVFLSYASQDAEAAKRICEALRAAGVEVWFDQSELRGGDAWDAQIRERIKECSLFVPVISANTNARPEGYFRLEWKLAVDRSHLLADDHPFLFPVVIGDVNDATARVPAKFKEVQWTRLRLDETPGELAGRVAKLLRGASRETAPSAPAAGGRAAPGKKPDDVWIRRAAVAFGLIVALVFALRPVWITLRPAKPAAPAPAAPAQTEAARLTAQARALIEDPLRVKVSYRAAEDLCARAVALDPQDAGAWAVYADVASDLIFNYNDHSEQQKANARTRAERAFRLAPASLEAGLAMAHYETVMGDDRLLVAAEQRLRALLVKTPADQRGLVMLGNTLGFQGKVAEAMATYDQCNRLPGGSAEALARKAWTLYHTGQPAAAVAAADASLAVAPNTHAYGAKLISLLLGLGDLPRMRTVLEAMPPAQWREDRVAFFAYQMWMLLREPEQAAEALRRIDHDFIQEGRLTMPTHFGLGDAQRLAGRPRAAAIEYESALATVDEQLKADPSSGDLAEWKTLLLARLGRSAEAQQWFQTTLELESIKPDEWAKMSPKTLVALGRLDDAISALQSRVRAGHVGTESNWRVDPEFDALHELPRFKALLEEADKSERKAGETGATTPAAQADAKSVAVLAFTNLSDDKDNEYFSDGISEELLNVLAKIPDLKVTARTSSFHFKGTNTEIPEIARQLGVAYVVEGSVRKQGTKVRITAQLIKADSGFHVWSDNFDRELKDVFAVQDEIAGLIAKNLSVRMGVTARAGHQVDPEALAALLEGRHYWVLRTTEGFVRAEELFNRAVTLDPQWAPAHAALASLLVIQASYQRGGGEAAGDRLELAAREAKRAIELDATLGEPHSALGKIAIENRRFAEAEEYYRRALALEPNSALIHDWYADLAVVQGRLDVATAEYRRALELDPLSPYIQWDLAWELMHVHRYAEALPLLDQAAALTPAGSPRLTLRRARVLLELGRKAEAEAVLRPYLAGSAAEGDPQLGNEAVWCLRALGMQAETERWAADLLRQNPDSFSSGVILIMQGQLDRAYPLLEKTPPIFLQQIYWESVFDPLRDTPRFQQLLATLGCVEEYKVARQTLARMLKEQEAKK